MSRRKYDENSAESGNFKNYYTQILLSRCNNVPFPVHRDGYFQFVEEKLEAASERKKSCLNFLLFFLGTQSKISLPASGLFRLFHA
jgi:hypothetical protein